MRWFQPSRQAWAIGLTYGVMVALQFLVLPVLVRIRVSQLWNQKGRVKNASFWFRPPLYLQRFDKKRNRGPVCLNSDFILVRRGIAIPFARQNVDKHAIPSESAAAKALDDT